MSRQQDDTTQSSYLNIIMYSDEHGETTVEGDEEEEQLPNGQHYEDGVFEIDDLPMDLPLCSSPDMQVRYYAPTNEAPHGLSQSVETNYCSMILSTENSQGFTTYSQSAPVYSSCFLSNRVQKESDIYENDSEKKENVVLNDKELQEKEKVVLNDKVLQEEESPLQMSEASSSSSENNLQLVRASPSVIVDNSLEAWNSLATAYFNTNGEVDHWRNHMNNIVDVVHEENINHTVGFVTDIMSHAVPMKVSGMPFNTRHRDLQTHFFDISVLSIRYMNKLHYAYVTYLNYEEMMKAVFKFNRSVLKGAVIYCRPSFFEEFEKDNALNSKLLYRVSQRGSNRYHMRRESFIPEYHGIVQYGRDHSTRTDLLPYHPQFISRVHPSDQYSYSTFKPVIKLLSRLPYFSSYYVILKPWLKLDVQASKEYQYWSVSLDKSCQLNYLFRNSFEVNLIFGVKGTKAFQGYAVMKSEVLDLKYLMYQDTVGTIFQETGAQFRTRTTGRPWRYVFRVEWKSTKKVGFALTKKYINPWFNNTCVNISKDCTVVEPYIGKEIVRMMNSP